MEKLIPSALFLALSSLAAGQQQVLIAEESFEYALGTNLGGLDGGSGWLSSWWSGSGADGAVVTGPGYDALGEMISQNILGEGNYRRVELTGHDDVTEDGRLGADDTTLWIAFRSMKHTAAGLGNYYGGLSLFRVGTGEMLFLGSPYLLNEWGVEQTGVLGAVTVPGSNVYVPTLLVYRLDFLPGQERVQLWLDPVDAHPTTVADLDTMVEDFRWDEVRFEAGLGDDPAGWDFDALLLEKEKDAGPIGQNYCSPANSNSSGQSATISAFGSLDVSENLLELTAAQLPLNQFGYFLCSETKGFVPFPGGSQGNLCLGGTIARFNSQVKSSGGAGLFQIDVDLTSIPMAPPVGVQPGETWNFVAWFRDNNPAPTSNFTDGIEITFQ